MFSPFNFEFYKVLFLIEIFIAEFLFTFQMKKKKNFFWRVIGSSLICLLIAYFIPVFSYESWYESIIFIVLFSMSIGVLCFCYDAKFFNLLFCAIAAYSMQHISYQLQFSFLVMFDIIQSPLGIYGEVYMQSFDLKIVPIYFMSYFIVYWLVFLISSPHKKDWENIEVRSGALLILVGILVIMEIIINSVVSYNSYIVWDKVYLVTASLAGIICCVLSLWVQFNLLSHKKLKEELDSIYHLYYQEQKQFLTSKNNIDLINRKCHDLKHQIRLIGQNGEVREEVIKEIENCIRIYDSEVKTGNKTLEIILTEKSLACHNAGITFTCVADGEKLSFMTELDLFTLFGNAIDNAIEAVVKLDDEKRVISLTTKLNKNMFSVCIRNYFDGKIFMEKGSIKTTKNNQDYHGFGLKSIEEIVKRYGGDIDIFVEDGIFNLTLLFFLD